MRFYTPAVQWMVDNDITTGVSPSCFAPDEFVTRGQAAAFMWRMEGFPAPGVLHPFSDVIAAYQQDPVSWMFNNEITTGTSASTYSPDDVLTRGQMAALLYRLAGFPPPGPPHPFDDVVKDWQQDAISWMFNQGITTGTSPTMFSPDDPVTRGQLAAFFYRYKGSPLVQVVADSPDCGTPPNPGDIKNCADFEDQGSAQRWHDYYFPFYGDVANLDADGDGIVCVDNATTTSTSTTSSSTTSTSSTTTTTTTTTMPPNGAALFANTPSGPGTSTQNCSTCHGANGNGTGQGPDINPNNLSRAAIETQIRTGGAPGGMPSDFEDRLTDAEIDAVADFVFESWSTQA